MPSSDRRSSRLNLMASGLMLAAALITLTVSTRSLAGVPERIGLTVISFFQKGFDAVGDFFTDTVNSIAELRQLQDSHRELLARVEALGNLERGYTELRRENERLQEQLGFELRSERSLMAARIVAKDPENLFSTFVVDKGSLDGVRKNQAVVAYQDGIEGLVGRVLEVGRSTCTVVPVYDSSSFIAVRLERSRYDGLATGSGNRDDPLVVKYIKKRAGSEIQFGDLVVTSGLQSIYPAGIVVGRVSKLRLIDYLTSLELEMEPILDFGRLEYVFLVGGQDGTAAEETP